MSSNIYIVMFQVDAGDEEESGKTWQVSAKMTYKEAKKLFDSRPDAAALLNIVDEKESSFNPSGDPADL